MISVKLINGMEVPMIGLGTYSLSKEHVLNGLNAGYRLIDTASQYGNEREIGAAIRSSGIAREEIILVTKLGWMILKDTELGKLFLKV